MRRLKSSIGVAERVPGALRAPGDGVPVIAHQRLAVVAPGCIEHPQRAVLDAVAHEVVDIGDGLIEIGQHVAQQFTPGQTKKSKPDLANGIICSSNDGSAL